MGTTTSFQIKINTCCPYVFLKRESQCQLNVIVQEKPNYSDFIQGQTIQGRNLKLSNNCVEVKKRPTIRMIRELKNFVLHCLILNYQYTLFQKM